MVKLVKFGLELVKKVGRLKHWQRLVKFSPDLVKKLVSENIGKVW